jgi:hypothetical protein
LNKLFWMIEKDTWPEAEETRLKQSLTELDIEYVEVQGNLAGKQYIDGEITWDDKYRFRPCVFWGSLSTARWLQNHSLRSESVVCNFPGFDCLSYYPEYINSLLNADDYIILPLSEAIRRKDLLFSKGDSFFVRPSSGAKEFSGRVLTYENFTLQSVDHGIYFNDPNILVLIAPAKNVLHEYRFFVDNEDQILMASSDAPPEAHEFVQKKVLVDNDFDIPDWIYVVDVCQYEDCGEVEYAVTELNSASCSGIYNCFPLENWVKKMGDVVTNRWKDLHDE